MTDKRILIHLIFLTIAPIVVAWFGMSVFTASLLVVLLLGWRWLIVLSGFSVPEKSPELVLETISASHFVEKVRWSMDRLGISYTEQAAGATLGAFFRGRTVPQLKIRTGSVRSVIGNSPDILRYLWGRYAAENPAAAAFLEPTTERLELEQRLDRHGVNLQVWIYYRILADRETALHAWGVNNPLVPLWQRQLLRLLFPILATLVRRAFSINDVNFARSVGYIEELLADLNSELMDGRESLLGGAELNYTDIAFASMTGLWLMPAGFGGGKADNVRIERDRVPAPMRSDIEAWESAYPRAVAFVEGLYSEERLKNR
ncbi:MAG: glutathione S-transferase domain-containing protein [Proteobacteria bacterium]|nr:glutathione S-transferase domain-containing protein [Pseudomonadota bacterium]